MKSKKMFLFSFLLLVISGSFVVTDTIEAVKKNLQTSSGINYNIELPGCDISKEFKDKLISDYGGNYYKYLKDAHPEIKDTLSFSKMNTKIRNDLVNGWTDGSLDLNMDLALKHCLVVYGDGNDLIIKAKGGPQTFRHGKEDSTFMLENNIDYYRPLFLGVTLDGQNLFPNPAAPEYFAGKTTIEAENWIADPWLPSNGVINDPQGRFNDVLPKSPKNINDTEYLIALSKVIDKYNMAGNNGGTNLNGGRGKFVGNAPNGKPWIATVSTSNNSTFVYTTNSVALARYASVFIERSAKGTPDKPSTWFPGAFTMYFIRDNGWAGYSTFILEPEPIWIPIKGTYDHVPDCTYLQVDPAFPAEHGKPVKITLKNSIVKYGTPDPVSWSTAKTVDPVAAGLWNSSMGNSTSVKGVQNIPAGISVAYRWAGIEDTTEASTYYSTWVPMLTNPGVNTYTLQKGTINLSNGSKTDNVQLLYPKPDAEGYATLVVNMNFQRDHYYYPSLYGKPEVEEFTDNNVCNYRIKIKENQDASVKLDASSDPANPTLASTNTPLNGVMYTITNSMKQNISLPCAASGTAGCLNSTDRNFKLVITNLTTGKVVDTPKAYIPSPTGTQAPKTIVMGKTYSEALEQIVLPTGKYKLEIFIPRYSGEDDSSKTTIQQTNNYAVGYLDVQILMPPNTKCDKYMKLGTSAAQNIAKMCYGYYPNYPSNWTEGGIGTYFAIKYFFFPTPLPNYNVTNGGTVTQTVTANDPKSAAGSCVAGSATNCTDLESFFYFPTVRVCDANTVSKSDCVSSLPATYNPKGLKGPYSAGAHSFFHFLYRGRMMAESVQFNFVVYDVAGHAIATNDPALASGSGAFIYNVPNGIEKTTDKGKYVSRDSLTTTGGNRASDLTLSMPTGYTYTAANDCFRQDMIDYTDSCRSITFYLPNTVANMFNSPVESDKVQFLNVGTHSFQLDAVENQKYYYQHDDGNEYQGSRTNAATLPSGWSAPYLTNAIDSANQKYTPQENIANHCEKQTDAFGVVTGTSCFHDSDKEYQYWLYNWSRVYRYDKDFLATW